jgi:DNA-binding transcriptional LysR family regulator
MDRLRAMELFLSISQTRNFSETARRFGISATGVSRMITEIEEDLKVKLLLRSTRQVALTESGEEYARQLEGILWRINELQTNITAISAAPQGLLRVHSRVMFGLGVLPPLIAAFRKLYPEIHIELSLTEAAVDLRRSQVDIDFRISPPVEAGVKRRMLFQSERHLVAAASYLAGKPALQAPESILEHDCLAYQLPGDEYTWMFKQQDEAKEIAFMPRHVSNNGIALLELARLGEGLVLLDDYTVHNDIRQGRLVRVLADYRISNKGFDEGMYATILDTPIIPAKIRLFLDFVAEHVAGPELRFSAHGKAAGLGSLPAAA